MKKIKKSLLTFLTCVFVFVSCLAVASCDLLGFEKACDHQWGEWITEKEATCSEVGEKYRVCALDESHVERKPIEKLAHDVITHEAKEPTYEAVGWDAYETCSNCDYTTYHELPKKCWHNLTCSYTIINGVMIVSQGYTCSECQGTFEPADVLVYTFENATEKGYYKLTIDCKIDGVADYDLYGSGFQLGDVKIADGCSFPYQNDWEENKKKLRELEFGDNISSIGKIDYYTYLTTLVIGENVKTIKTDAICDLFALKEIYFEGDLPTLEPDALWRRYGVVDGESPVIEPIAYYKDGAKGFEEYGCKLQGCSLRKLGETAPTLPQESMQEYAQQTNARSIEMATQLFEKSAKTRPFLQFIPFCSLSEYKEIKDLALSLTKNLTTDKAKAKAIFDWIVANITYDGVATFYPVEKVFETRKAVCAGYAGLMYDMLAAVKIPSLYVNGVYYFGTECTVEEILDGSFAGKYEGIGHGWLICYLDGEATICDPTWGNFDITPSELTEMNLATTGINAFSVIPEAYDPALYADLLYYDDGDLYNLYSGNLTVFSGTSLSINGVFPFYYRFRIPNDSFEYGFGFIDCKLAYKEMFVYSHGVTDYKHGRFYGSDFREYSYVEVLEFLAFEKLWYNESFEIDLIDEFLFDEYGTIYHINEGNTLSVVGSVSKNRTIVIPEKINGLPVTAIDEYAFRGSYATEIVLPDCIEKIGAHAFLGSHIESIVLPKNLKILEPGAFAGCYNLTSVTMYANVELIGCESDHVAYIPFLLFEGLSTEQLTVYYQGTQEDFEKIHFKKSFYDPKILYEHVKSYVQFQN